MDGLVKKINSWVPPPLIDWVGQKNINQWVPLPVNGWVGLHMGPEHAAREKKYWGYINVYGLAC